MLEEDRYCIDILTQIGAVSTALESLAFRILDDHVSHCVSGALSSGDPEVAAEKRRSPSKPFTASRDQVNQCPGT